MTVFYKWLEENRKQQRELVAIFEKQIEYIANANKRIRELESELEVYREKERLEWERSRDD